MRFILLLLLFVPAHSVPAYHSGPHAELRKPPTRPLHHQAELLLSVVLLRVWYLRMLQRVEIDSHVERVFGQLKAVPSSTCFSKGAAYCNKRGIS